MTRRNGGRARNRAFAAPAVEEGLSRDQAVEAFINGELDTDVLSNEELNDLLSEVEDDEMDALLENNPTLDLADEDEDEDDGDIAEDVEAILDAVAAGEMDPDEAEDIIAEAVETGELVLTDEDGNELDPEDALEEVTAMVDEAVEDGEDDGGEDDEGDGEDDDARGFALGEDDYYDEDDDDEFFEAPVRARGRSRAFSAGDVEDAYAQGQADAAELAEDAAQRIYAENQTMQQRAFALEEALEEGEDIVEQAVEEGRIPPHLAGLASAIMISANSIQGEVRSFAAAEMDDELGEASLADLFAEFIMSISPNSMFQPIDTEPSLDDVRAFTADDLMNAHNGGAASERVGRAIRAIQNDYAAKGQQVSFTEVFRALQQEVLGG